MQRVTIASLSLVPLLLCIGSLTGCMVETASTTDDFGACNILGGSRRNNYYAYETPAVDQLTAYRLNNLPQGFTAPPLPLSRGRMILTGEERTVTLATLDSVLWTYQFPEGRETVPEVGVDRNGNCYVVANDNMLSALDTSGTLLWEQPVLDPGHTSPLIFAPPLALDQGVIVAASTGDLVRFDETGNLLWHTRRGGAIIEPTAADPVHGLVAAITQSEYGRTDTVAVFDPVGGTEHWTFPIDGRRILCGPVISGNLILVGTAYRNAQGALVPELIALSGKGSEAWRAPLRLLPKGIGTDGRGNLYVTTSGTSAELSGGTVTSFDSTGSRRWEAVLRAPLFAPPTVTPGLLYVLSRSDGGIGVYSYGLEGGLRSFFSLTTLPDVHARPVASPAGLLFGARYVPAVLQASGGGIFF